jgi:preprotein translocase subunit SecD
LYWFGDQFAASLVKGFALTLALGVAVSLFSAIFVTRTLLHLLIDVEEARGPRATETAQAAGGAGLD